MDISMESFREPSGRRGALVRRRGPREIRTLAVLPTDDGIYHVETTTSHPGDLLAWTEFTLKGADGILTIRRDGPTLDIDGTSLEVPADTLPSHVASVLLEDMLAQCGTEAEFHRIDEADPTRQPPGAHFSVGNPEPVRLADGNEVELGVVDLYISEERIQRFWFDSHDVIVSDWNGARSYRVDTVEELVEGMDPQLADIARGFCG